MTDNSMNYESLSTDVGNMLTRSIHTRTYNVLLANELNRAKAIMINQIHYLTQRLKDADHFRYGRYWVHETYDEWHEQFPEMSVSAIQKTLLSLEEEGYIFVGNFNEKKYDRTKWYAVNYEKVREALAKQKESLEITDWSSVKSTSDPDVKSTPPIPNKSSTNKGKINGAFPRNAQQKLDNNHIRDLSAFMFRTRQRISSWDDVNSYTDELCEALGYYFVKYQEITGVSHPPYSQKDIHYVCTIIINYLDCIYDMIDSYFSTESMLNNSDLRLMHFVSERILELRAYEVGAVDCIPNRTFGSTPYA